MTTSTIVLGIALGLAAGVLSGLFGVGGGILFVPTLVALGLGQIEAQATSLLAILPTVAVGAANQRRYGNLRVRTAVFVGVASLAGRGGRSTDRDVAAGDDAAQAVRRSPVRGRGAARVACHSRAGALP